METINLNQEVNRVKILIQNMAHANIDFSISPPILYHFLALTMYIIVHHCVYMCILCTTACTPNLSKFIKVFH